MTRMTRRAITTQLRGLLRCAWPLVRRNSPLLEPLLLLCTRLSHGSLWFLHMRPTSDAAASYILLMHGMQLTASRIRLVVALLMRYLTQVWHRTPCCVTHSHIAHIISWRHRRSTAPARSAQKKAQRRRA